MEQPKPCGFIHGVLCRGTERVVVVTAIHRFLLSHRDIQLLKHQLVEYYANIMCSFSIVANSVWSVMFSL